ncbi:MAG: hypothetical protein V3U32_03380 [Anaerolineales bacterium]
MSAIIPMSDGFTRLGIYLPEPSQVLEARVASQLSIELIATELKRLRQPAKSKRCISLSSLIAWL